MTSTRRLIEAGGPVDKAGLLDLDADALDCARLSLRDGAATKTQIGNWAAVASSIERRTSPTKARKKPC
jgi:hypothetical protein